MSTHLPIKYEILITTAILNHKDDKANSGEIITFIRDHYRGIFKGRKENINRRVCFTLSRMRMFVKIPLVNGKKKGHKWTVTDEWKQHFIQEELASLPARDPSQIYKQVKNKPPQKYEMLITEAILCHPGEQATVDEIRDYLHENFEYFRAASSAWRKTVHSILSTKKIFMKGPAVVSVHSGRPAHKWIVTEEWKQEFKKRCPHFQSKEYSEVTPEPIIPNNPEEMSSPIKPETLTTYALMSHPEEQATIAEIYDFLVEKFDFFPDNPDRGKEIIYRELSRKKVYVKLSEKVGGKHKWGMTPGWRKRAKEGCPLCVVKNSPSKKEKVMKNRFSCPPAKYEVLITAAILSQPEEQATILEIFKFLVRNFRYFRTAYEVWRTTVKRELAIKKFYIPVAGNELDSNDHKGAVTDEWSQLRKKHKWTISEKYKAIVKQGCPLCVLAPVDNTSADKSPSPEYNEPAAFHENDELTAEDFGLLPESEYYTRKTSESEDDDDLLDDFDDAPADYEKPTLRASRKIQYDGMDVLQDDGNDNDYDMWLDGYNSDPDFNF